MIATDLAKAAALLSQLADPKRKGSDLSDIFAQLKAWADALDLSGYTMEVLHAMLHFVVDTLLPKLKEYTPIYGDMIIDGVVIPLLKKIDERWHPAT